MSALLAGGPVALKRASRTFHRPLSPGPGGDVHVGGRQDLPRVPASLRSVIQCGPQHLMTAGTGAETDGKGIQAVGLAQFRPFCLPGMGGATAAGPAAPMRSHPPYTGREHSHPSLHALLCSAAAAPRFWHFGLREGSLNGGGEPGLLWRPGFDYRLTALASRQVCLERFGRVEVIGL